jgi:phosphoglycolate phosphatase-like HAD superfamily hydrolase
VNFQVRAITLDLDDTLWPFAPVGARVEHVLHDWLVAHVPRTAEQFPVHEMRRLREVINAEHPHLAHDFSTLRKLTLARAMELAGDDVAHVEPAFEAFFAERNRVECYPDAIPALERIAARLPIAALTNGNADLQRIGLRDHFSFQLGASESRRAEARAQHLPRCLRAPRRRAASRAARGDDIELTSSAPRCRAAGPAGSTATTCTARSRAGRTRIITPDLAYPTPRRAGRLAGRAHCRTTPHAYERFADATSGVFATSATARLPLVLRGAHGLRRLARPAIARARERDPTRTPSPRPPAASCCCRARHGSPARCSASAIAAIRSPTRTRRWRCRRATGRSHATWTRTRAARCNSAGASGAIASRATSSRCVRRRAGRGATRRGNARHARPPALRVRDLVNTPTEDMGPDQLEQACCELAERHGATIEAISGDDLLKHNFPAIHAVGRASHRAPR